MASEPARIATNKTSNSSNVSSINVPPNGRQSRKIDNIILAPHSENKILFSPMVKSFQFNELKNATRNFRLDSLLGEGGFCYMFKGWIDEHTLTTVKHGFSMVVAVKRLKPEGFQGHKEWLTEVNYLGQLHHPNLVKLIGYCYQGDHRLLVYEFLPKGTLKNHLFRRL
ncbi:unnamed protein product [Cuscuta europaea]|uniref:non-specific serine/threonine protein kinase n=2 Tax=Cuscuta europaea TaxID=41803 RepID=A0A9P0Z4I0_CUSEU|nr:unnamed protein product [Cuscuta europaea]